MMHRLNLHRLPNLLIKARSKEKALVGSQSSPNLLNRAAQLKLRLASQQQANNRRSNASLTKFSTQMKFSLSTT